MYFLKFDVFESTIQSFISPLIRFTSHKKILQSWMSIQPHTISVELMRNESIESCKKINDCSCLKRLAFVLAFYQRWMNDRQLNANQV